jgi:hypothetical protein
VLNVPASIEATLHSGGIPTLEFSKRRQVRSLLILEDVFAEATAWNSIARELAEGMRQRGVPVLYGQFSGSPERFKTEDGSVYHLEDLEDERRGYLLLIFTDGKGLYRHESTFALEDLARWPMVAWMELREPRFWDETSVLPTRYGIPIYPATPAGAVWAVRRFLTEQGIEADFSEQAIHWHGIPDQADAHLGVYVEGLLGDALIWAQDCAMLQPISPGLVDALRREFHPHLPRERIERLNVLPGTQCNASGLRFSDEVLSVLRTGFLIRRDEEEQEDVLRFLLRKVQEAEPDQEDSLAHLAWETVEKRILLELDLDDDLERLTQLAKTPLGRAVTASLENFGFPGQAGKIPLRLKPRNKHALQRLARISENFSIPILEAYPVAWGHWLALGILFFSFLGFSGWSVQNYAEILSWDIDNLYAIAALRLELLEEGTWQEVWHHIPAAETTSATFGQTLLEGRDYRVTLYGGGYQTIEKLSTTDSGIPLIELGWQDVEVDCSEEFPDVGLTIRRCPDSESDEIQPVHSHLWRERTTYRFGPLLSAGLEITTDGQNDALLQRWHDVLLQTGSIDVLYQIQPNSSGEWNIEQALEQLQMDLGPLAEQSQLLWWEAGQTPDTAAIEDFLPGFERILRLGNGEDLSWTATLEPLFERADDPRVWEYEILAALGQEQPEAGGLPAVVLNRPSSRRVHIDPPSMAVTVAETTTANIRIENVTGLFGAEVHLTFDPGLLEVVDADTDTAGVQIQPGPFLFPDFVARNNADQTSGRIVFAVAHMPPHLPVDGSGVLATITFKGKAAGTSALSFWNTWRRPVILADRAGEEIDTAVESGSVIEITTGMPPTLAPTPTPTRALTPTPTPCVPRIELLSYLTTPDSTTLFPGSALTMTWVLWSTDSCPWPEDSRIIFVGGDPMGGPGEQRIDLSPSATGAVTVSVHLVAPAFDGEYESIWQIRDAQGNLISEELHATVVVSRPPTPLPSYPKPVLTGLDIFGCSVTFHWIWSGWLAEDTYFAVRAGIGAPGYAKSWTKDTQLSWEFTEPGNYVWEVAICRGTPGGGICEQLAVSEQDSYYFGGCR